VNRRSQAATAAANTAIDNPLNTTSAASNGRGREGLYRQGERKRVGIPGADDEFVTVPGGEVAERFEVVGRGTFGEEPPGVPVAVEVVEPVGQLDRGGDQPGNEGRRGCEDRQPEGRPAREPDAGNPEPHGANARRE
jgi:hypothetical protein